MAGLIKHCDVDFDISHLDQHIENCTWTSARGKTFTCLVKIRYSSHCYSFEDKGEAQPEGSHLFDDAQRRPRVFCPMRHTHSLELRAMMQGLCAKPTETIFLTPEANWTIYRLSMPSKLLQGETFWIFFRLKKEAEANGLPTEVDLYVESAYPRRDRPVFKRKSMFGRSIEQS